MFILLIEILLSTLRKQKVVLFRNGGKIKSTEKWNLNGHRLEIVDKFVYLGVLLNFKILTLHQCILKLEGFQWILFVFLESLNFREFKVLCSENCVIKNCYGELYNNCERMNKSNRNWVCCIKDKLFEIGLGYVLDEQNKTNCIELIQLLSKDWLISVSKVGKNKSIIHQSVLFINILLTIFV